MKRSWSPNTVRICPGQLRLMHSAPSAAPSSSLPSGSTSTGSMPNSGRVAEPGFRRVQPGSGGDHHAAGLGLPPGVDDGAARLAHHVVVPLPRLGVDGLAHRAEDAQALAAGALDEVVALAHERADRGRRGVEDVHAVLVADLPEAAEVGVVRDPLEHHRGGAVRQRRVRHVRMARDPAHVGGAPEGVAFVVVEDVLEGQGGVEQESSRGCAGRPSGCRSSPRCRG